MTAPRCALDVALRRAGDASPASVFALNTVAIPDHHVQAGLKHPLAIYNASLSALLRRGSMLCDEVVRALLRTDFGPRGGAKDDWDLPLLECADHFLDAVAEHFDDCKKLLWALYPMAQREDAKGAHRRFEASIQWYRDHIGTIVNKLKHDQARLRSLVFWWPTGVSVGYFVEGIVAPGRLGPDPQVHPNATAFSFARDMRLHLCGLFSVAEQLRIAVRAIDESFVLEPRVGDQPSGWNALLDAVYGLPLHVFPDEVTKPTPWVGKKADEYTLRFPSLNRFRPVPRGAQVTTKLQGDGVTRSFQVPYFAAPAMRWNR